MELASDDVTVKTIPFLYRFREPLLSGRKTWTTRSRQMVRKGEIFEAFGTFFLVEDTRLMKLGQVAEHWKEEGCESRLDFERTWCGIHKLHSLPTPQNVVVHIFRRLDSPDAILGDS